MIAQSKIAHMKYTWKSSFCKTCWFLHLGWSILPCSCLPQGCIYVSRQRIPLRREGNICLPSYDTNPKPIPRARSLPRCRCARKRIGMGSSASINLPSRNDEPTPWYLRKKASVSSQKVPKLIVHLSAISGDKELESMGG